MKTVAEEYKKRDTQTYLSIVIDSMGTKYTFVDVSNLIETNETGLIQFDHVLFLGQKAHTEIYGKITSRTISIEGDQNG